MSNKVVTFSQPPLSKVDYKAAIRKLESLPIVAIVTTGRTGSDFLQSLFDSHPEIVTFNGHFAIYSEFFEINKLFNTVGAKLSDKIDAFIQAYEYKLVSRLEIQERKDQLGENSDQSFEFDLDNFKTHMLGLLNETECSTKFFLLAIYGAYAICRGGDISTARVIVHHPHLEYEFEKFHKDFTKTRVIFTSRDPRANFCSHVENFRRYYQTHDNQYHLYNCLKMIIHDTRCASEKGLDHISTRLEDLPRPDVLRSLASWLDIEFNEILLRSTWAGLDWYGDRISGKTFKSVGWSPNRGANQWETRLGALEKYVFNFLLNDRLKKYGYENQPISILDIMLIPLLLLFPWRYEWRFLSTSYLIPALFFRGAFCRRMAMTMPIFYIKRVALCYIQYLRVVSRKSETVIVAGMNHANERV